jgi:mono/diheme cytochrome c family protein
MRSLSTRRKNKFGLGINTRMRQRLFGLASVTILVVIMMLWLFMPPRVPEIAIPSSPEAIERGQYLIHAGGCISCHIGNDSRSLSGGVSLESEFGTFHVPNITPDPVTGIGDWTGKDFLLAMQHGRRPDGGFYYPAFPYRSYAGMNDEDVVDIAAFLMAQTPVHSAISEHQLAYPIQRWMIAGWNRLADLLQPTLPAESDLQIARGAYLARHLGHCGECHTPRNRLGIPDPRREFAGTTLNNKKMPAISPDALADWTQNDLVLLLLLGLKPDDDYVGGDMGSVIEHNTSQLTDDDRLALAAFLKRGAE